MKLKPSLLIPKGLSLIELILAMAVFSVLSGALITLVVGAYSSNLQSSKLTRATFYLQETNEALRSLGNQAWNYLAAGTYGLEYDGTNWSLMSDPDEISGSFIRTITIEDVDRDETTGELADSGYSDVYTRQITTDLNWPIWEGRDASASQEIYLTNHTGQELTFSDWSDSSAYNSVDSEVETSVAGQLSLANDGSSNITMEVGSLTTEEGVGITMETGTVSADGSGWTSVAFTNLDFTDPIIVATQIEANNSSPVSVRFKDITSTGFDVTLQAPDGSHPSAETVAYLAVERGTWYLDGYKVEADSDSVSSVGSNLTSPPSWTGELKNYQHVYSSRPIVLHQVQTDNDSDWIVSWVSSQVNRSSPPTVKGFQIGLNGAEVTAIHDPEEIGWIVLEKNISGTISGVDFETQMTSNSVRGHNTCSNFNYSQVNSADAFTISGQQEMDSVEGAWSVICDQGNNYVGLHSEEDQVYDSERFHTTETHGFISFSEPAIATYSEGWTTVNLEQEYDSPVVIITGYENSLDIPLSARLKDISSKSFKVTLQSPDGSTGHVDDFYYLVIEDGSWTIGSTTIEAHQTKISTVSYSGGTWTGETQYYDQTYSNYPIILHQVMSYNDSNWTTSWISAAGNNFGPPNKVGFQLGLHCGQAATTHDSESVGWVVIQDSGSDSIEGINFYVDRPRTEVRGHDQGCTNYSYGGSHSNPIVLASQQEMDGVDGSWLRICDVTTATVGFHAEEDQEGDAERSHPTEIIGYLVFSEAFSVNGDTYYDQGTLESPVFGPYSNYNLITWDEVLPSDCLDCLVQVQIKTSADGTTWSSDWSDYYETSIGQLIDPGHIGDYYLKYLITLTGDASSTPILEELRFNYYE